MLKKIFLAVSAAAVCMSFTACSSFSTAANLNGMKLTTNPQRTTLAHVHAEITGVYLLGVIPFFTGSAIQPEKCAAFEDNVTVPRAVGLLTKTAHDRMAASYIEDVQTEKTSVWLAPTILFWYKSIQVSGNALK